MREKTYDVGKSCCFQLKLKRFYRKHIVCMPLGIKIIHPIVFPGDRSDNTQLFVEFYPFIDIEFRQNHNLQSNEVYFLS